MKLPPAFLRKLVLPAVLCFAAAWGLAQTQLFENFEGQILDVATKNLRVKFQKKPDPRMAVIAIDDDSIERLGMWPWPRVMHGTLMALIAKTGASVIAWDILFTEPDNNKQEYDQKLLAGTNSAVKAGVSVIHAAVTDPTGGPISEKAVTQPVENIEGDIQQIPGDVGMLGPLPPLQERSHFASVDTPPGPDGVRRVAPLLARAGKKVYTSLSLESLLQYWHVAPKDVRVKLGDAIYVKTADGEHRIPIDATGGYLVNYRFGAEGAIEHGYAQLIIRLNERFVEGKTDTPPVDLKDKILVVGQVATALTDLGPTPLSPHTPLVMVHANVINNLLQGDYAFRANQVAVWGAVFLVALVGLAFFADSKLPAQASFSFGVPLLYLVLFAVLWVTKSIWLPVAGPMVAFGMVQVFMIARRVIIEQRAKEQIKGMFGSYVSPALVGRMVESGEMPKLGGHQEEITAYFSDIQSFSTFSEMLPPDKLVELMNEYLTACTDLIQEGGGTLDKYIGDAVVVMFGAPIALPDHAYRACLATQRVQQRLGELREKWIAEGDKWPAIVGKMQSRIGLNSGLCTIGNMGSRTRFNYTMMGDNVNLAARMESGAKSWGVYTMVAEATKTGCEKHGGDHVVFRALGRIVVMGRSQAVPIYEVVGLKETISQQWRECIGTFEQGWAKYQAQDWDAALKLFHTSAALEPRKGGKVPTPSELYINFTEELKLNPPPASWDGTRVMKEK